MGGVVVVHISHGLADRVNTAPPSDSGLTSAAQAVAELRELRITRPALTDALRHTAPEHLTKPLLDALAELRSLRLGPSPVASGGGAESASSSGGSTGCGSLVNLSPLSAFIAATIAAGRCRACTYQCTPSHACCYMHAAIA